ncbi:MAG TPA: NUDIX domain-containing protein [Candidatus Saccharimonadales bacterium]|nr:NUDIX domain-containing protein [Candidatus Saccharimonadales bacterium]
MSFFIGAGLILAQGDKFVLIKEVRNEKANLYNLPAGTLEVGEDLIECITREAKEETGADIALECFVGIYQTVIATGSNVVFTIFAGHAPSNAVFHSDEHDVIEALTYEEIVELDKAGKLRAPTILKAIEDYRAGQKLPLTVVQSWHIAELASITVEKSH